MQRFIGWPQFRLGPELRQGLELRREPCCRRDATVPVNVQIWPPGGILHPAAPGSAVTITAKCGTSEGRGISSRIGCRRERGIERVDFATETSDYWLSLAAFAGSCGRFIDGSMSAGGFGSAPSWLACLAFTNSSAPLVAK